MGFCRNILGRVYMYLPRCNIGEGGVRVHWLDYSCQHNAHSHYKYMPAVLHNWIKSEATVPQNKKAVRLMRTRSGSERCRIVPVSISCLSLFSPCGSLLKIQATSWVLIALRNQDLTCIILGWRWACEQRCHWMIYVGLIPCKSWAGLECLNR